MSMHKGISKSLRQRQRGGPGGGVESLARPCNVGPIQPVKGPGDAADWRLMAG